MLLAQWSPSGNSLVYVQDNDIYYKKDVNTSAIRLTFDGNLTIYNGVCDWVYEEEVFSTKKAIWISPDSTKLAYIRFDDNPVRVMDIPVYGTPGIQQFQYPNTIFVPYPKTGTGNPIASLHIIDLTKLNDQQNVPDVFTVPIPTELQNREYIISVVSWANSKTLLSTYMNRVQNEAYIQTCQDKSCKPLYSMSSKTGWLDFFKEPTFNADGTEFVYITSQPQSNNDSYRHLTLVSMTDGKQTALTQGNFIVSNVLAWDTDENIVFYAANGENASDISNIFAVSGNVTGDREPYCLSCNVVVNNVTQTHFSADISPKWNRAILTNDGPSIAQVKVIEFKLTRPVQYSNVYTWEDNAELVDFMKNVSLPEIQNYRISLDSGFEAVVKLKLPPNADLSGKTKYPMIIDVYAGPGSYAGSTGFDVGFGGYMTSNKSFVYAQINGRGSGNRGDKLLHTIYRAMGTVEIDDQIETAKKLPKIAQFIDPNRIGIWGWSYGGYAAGMVLAKDNETVFQCAASVAPVTDWTYYGKFNYNSSFLANNFFF